MKSLNSKITNSIIVIGTILIVSVYVTLYFISIERAKDFHVEKLDNTMLLLNKELTNENTKLEVIQRLIVSDKHIKTITINDKIFNGQSASDEMLFYKTFKINNKDIRITYGDKAKDKYISALKIRMFIVASMFYILVFFIYKQIGRLLNPFQEIIEYFEKFILNRDYKLKFKEEDNVAREFEYVKNSINIMQSNIIEYSEEINKLAFTDSLTSLPNRASYYKEVKKKWNKSEHFSVCFMDLDGFKYINDSYGHSTGDLLLQKISDKLNHLNIYRIGGDEFIIIIDSVNEEIINNVSNEIIYLVNEDIFINSYILNVSTSIGIAVKNKETESAEDLLTESDIAMYVSKNKGKNNITYFNDNMYEDIKNQVELLYNIRKAAENEEFTFFVQPQVSSKDGSIVGGEALIRWNFEGQILTPFHFIKELENSKYIFSVGNQIIKKVMNYANELSIKNIDFGRLSINLAEKQINSEIFIIDIVRILKETGVNANLIEFEITERWKNIESPLIKQNLIKLKELGFSISIDDFGEDNSSFKRADIFPIDQIKLDKNFADRLFDTPSSVNSITAILTYSKLIDVKFIVEGVEQIEQVDKLREIGVDLFQGFYYHRPLSTKDFERLFRK